MGIGSSGVVNCANTYLGTANYTVADGYVADRTPIVDGNGPAQLNLNFARNEVLDPRITFSRTSNATRVNAQGLIEYAPHNLLTYSENFDNAVWVKGTGVTVTPNTTIAPDGTTTADLISSPQDQGCYEYVLSIGTGITVTNSIYIKAGTATQLLFRDDLGTGRHIVINPSTGQIVGSSGTIISSGSISMGNGWYRYYMTYVTDFVNARNWVRNNTTGTLTYYTWGAQLNIGSLQPYYTTSVKNLLGYSQNFENAAWTKSNSNVLTNLLTYSQEFDNAVWVKGTGVTVTPNTTIAPDGTTTADLISSPQDQGCYEYVLSIGTGITVTNSIYIKAGTATQLIFRDDLGTGRHIVINPSTGQIVGSSGSILASGSISMGNGWYRYYMTYVTDSVNARNWVRNDTAGTLTYYTWGAQLVQGTNPEEYAVTTSAPAPIQAMGPLGFLGAEKLIETTANAAPYMVQTATILNGTPFTASIFIKAGERTFARVRLGDAGFIYEIVINLASGIVTSTNGVGSNSVVNLGNGWFRISCTSTVVSGNIAYIGIYIRPNATTETYTGDGASGIYIFGAQLSDSASLDPYVYNFGAAPTSSAYYGPRFDYNPVTLAPKGLLIEEQRTNLLTYSSEFDNAIWVKGTGVTVTPNTTIAPDGTATADLISSPQDQGCYEYVLSIGTGITVTNSIYIKAGTATRLLFRDDLGTGRHIVINPSTGQITGSSGSILASGSISMGNGWYRYYMTYVTDAVNARNWVRNDTAGTLTYYTWGAQVEVGAFPTSYIPTTSAQVTRAADNASMVGTNFSSWYNQSEGTFSVNIDSGNTANAVDTSGSARGPLYVSDGTTTNRYRIGALTTTYIVTSGGVLSANISVGTLAANTNYKLASTYAVNSYQFANNGALGTEDTSGALPIGVNQMQLGLSDLSTGYLNGHIQSIKYYPRRLANTYLQSLTQ